MGRLRITVLVLFCWLFTSQSVQAEDRNFFTLKRSLGMVFMGSSALLVKKGFDLRKEANHLYGRYEKSSDPVEADQLYRRTTNRDVKSQVSWALGAAFAVSGARLLLSEEREAKSNERRVFSAGAKDGGYRFDPGLSRTGMGFGLKKIWVFF